MRYKFKPVRTDVEWKSWFAWHPISTRCELVWLETVERRMECGFWIYRFAPTDVEHLLRLIRGEGG